MIKTNPKLTLSSTVEIHRRVIDFKSNDVKSFESEYHENKAIWWYTKANFLYFNVNQALRKQDMKVLMKMGFFIQDPAS